jgi:hypothetical protein
MKRASSIVLVAVLCFSLAACSTDQVLADINMVLQTANVVCSSLGVVAPVEAAACSAIATIASTGLNVIKADYDAWKAQPNATNLQKLQGAIAELKANLPQELAAAHITNPQTQSTVTAWVNLVTSTLDSVLSILPNLATNERRKSIRLTSSFPTPQSIQARWQTEVCKGDPKCGSLVKAK